jgi:tetratricopeptide (TPR) repeat protein
MISAESLARSKKQRTLALLLMSWASLSVLIASPALAGPKQDGAAGVAALKRQSYAEAITLFTSAINSGQLSDSDTEYAYLCRGKAYLATGDYPDAIGDLDQATRRDPDDADARSTLQAAQARQGGGHAAGPTASPQAAGGNWGLLGSLVGRYYWFQASADDPHSAYLSARWIAPDQTLSLGVRSNAGLTQLAEYKLDPATGEILFAGKNGNVDWYGTASPSPSSWTLYADVNGTPVRITYSVRSDGSITEHEDQFTNGTWQQGTDIQLVETTRDALEEAGLIKKKR